jgi:hypothetical protein
MGVGEGRELNIYFRDMIVVWSIGLAMGAAIVTLIMLYVWREHWWPVAPRAKRRR